MTTVAPVMPQRSSVIGALADAVRPHWLRIDEIWEPHARRHDSHLRRQSGLAPRKFLVEAFTVALEHGFLRPFAHQLAKEDLVSGDLDDFDTNIETLIGTSLFGLQAFVNDTFRPVNARLAGKGILRACDYVCRIDIDNVHAGTGVLVAPTLVATAAHVVLPLLARTPDGSALLAVNGSLQAAPDSLRRITLTFGDAVDEGVAGGPPVRQAGRVATPHQDWLYWGSQPTSLEQTRALFDVRDIGGIAIPDGPWDIAVIRLAESPGDPGQPELVREPPRNPFVVHVLHHPHSHQDRGEPLLVSIGTLDEHLGGPPPLRFLHDANTSNGSSGAPLFDQEWRLVALHQAGPVGLPQHGQPTRPSAADRNRAIPIRYLRERLDQIGLPPPDDPRYLKALENAFDLSPFPYPVIGRRRTQQRLWRGLRSNAPAADRLLIVRGAAGTGKRFTTRLVKEYVGAHGGAVVAMDLANVLTDDAASFARRIARAMSAVVPNPPLDGLTTAPREIRRDVAPSLNRSWEDVAANHAIWLVLEGFAGAALDVPQAVGDLINTIIGQLADYPLLRLVLVGWLTDPPPALAESVEILEPPTGFDIADHFLPSGDATDLVLAEEAGHLLAAEHSAGHTGYAAAHRVVAALAKHVTPKLPGSEP